MTKPKKKKPKGTTEREFKRALVFTDPHAPEHDTRSVGAVLSYAFSQWWDYCVILGDFMDFGCISHHNKNKLRQVEGQRVLYDYGIGNELLDQIQTAVQHKNPSCEIVLLEGNHDEWVERYMDAQPALAGMLELDKNLRLAERGIKWVRSWSQSEEYKIGNVGFHHGIYVNKYHAAKMADAFPYPIIYGHTHSFQMFPKVYLGAHKTIFGQSLGFLGRYDMPYMKKKPSSWQQGFGEVYVFPDDYFQCVPIPIFKHRFVGQNGIVYQG